MDLTIESYGAINNMRNALIQFNSEVSEISYSIQNNMNILFSMCTALRSKTNSTVDNIESKCIQTENKIENLECNLNSLRHSLDMKNNELESLKSKASSYEYQINDLQNYLNELRSELSYADEEERPSIQSAIDNCTDKINYTKRNLQEIQDDIRETECNKKILANEISEKKYELEDTRSYNEILRKKRDFYINKLEKQNQLISRIYDEISECSNMLKQCSATVEDKSQSGSTALSKCMKYIDNYLNAL